MTQHTVVLIVMPRPGSPVPSTPERREGLRACYWEGPSAYLENPRDGGAWWAAIYGVAQSWTRLKRLSSRVTNTFMGEAWEEVGGNCRWSEAAIADQLGAEREGEGEGKGKGNAVS